MSRHLRRAWTYRGVRLFVLSYAIKTVLIGLGWWLIPDLPQRASDVLASTWGVASAYTPWASEPAAVAAEAPPDPAKTPESR